MTWLIAYLAYALIQGYVVAYRFGPKENRLLRAGLIAIVAPVVTFGLILLAGLWAYGYSEPEGR